LASLILLPHLDWGDIRVSNTKYVHILFDLASDLSCCKQGMTIISPPVLSTVINGLRRWEPVYNHRPLCWRCQSRRRQASFFSQCDILFLLAFMYVLTRFPDTSRDIGLTTEQEAQLLLRCPSVTIVEQVNCIHRITVYLRSLLRRKHKEFRRLKNNRTETEIATHASVTYLQHDVVHCERK